MWHYISTPGVFNKKDFAQRSAEKEKKNFKLMKMSELSYFFCHFKANSLGKRFPAPNL